MTPLDEDFTDFSHDYKQGFEAGWDHCKSLVMMVIYILIAAFVLLELITFIKPYFNNG